MRFVRRACVESDELITRARELPLERLHARRVFLITKIDSTRIEGSQDREWLAEAEGFQSVSRGTRNFLSQVHHHLRLSGKKQNSLRVSSPALVARLPLIHACHIWYVPC